MMKALNIFFILLFFLSALLQLNDPDPVLWAVIYLYGVFVCFLALRNQHYKSLYAIGLIAYSAYAIYIIFKDDGVVSWITEHDSEGLLQTMKATKPWIENAREFLGLVLLIIALGVNLFVSRRGKLNADNRRS